jgi:pseudouridine-5'-phosphate glycosidase
VALETTLLLHGVPRAQALSLARELADTVRQGGAVPVFVGVVAGRAKVGLDDADLRTLAAARHVPKLNTATLGIALHRGTHGATTVSTTMELAAQAAVRVFATGGIGGVHRGYAQRLDISADLAALARFPVAVVCSGCKSILDVAASREILETLGVPVVGFKTDRFPAFYRRDGGMSTDARFDDVADLATFVRSELSRTARGIVICNPIPRAAEIGAADWERWLAFAYEAAGQAEGREATPALLAALHRISKGATLRANIALVKSNALLAARLAAALQAGWTA